MLIQIREIVRESPPVPPRPGSKFTDSTIYWRMVVVPADDPSGNPRNIVVMGKAGPQGRRYEAGQQYELTLKGNDTTDKDGSVWAQAKLDKPGQGGASGPSGPKSAGDGPRPASGGSGGSGGRVRREVPRDIYFQKFATLYFESAAAHMEALVGWERRGNVEHPDMGRLWEQIGKVANQAAMSLGLECLPVSEAQKKKLEEEAKLKAEAELAAKRQKEEEEARRRLEEEQMREQEMDWS